MSEPPKSAPTLDQLTTDPGLCATCRNRRLLASARSVFVRCAASDHDPGAPRYPVLPVVRCSFFEVLR